MRGDLPRVHGLNLRRRASAAREMLPPRFIRHAKKSFNNETPSTDMSCARPFGHNLAASAGAGGGIGIVTDGARSRGQHGLALAHISSKLAKLKPASILTGG